MERLREQLYELIHSLSSVPEDVREDFLTRLKKGDLIRSEDPESHFCVFFVPFIQKDKKVFLGHHTKANSWIAPGGHIEPTHRTPIATVMQEAKEELGVDVGETQIGKPFFISVMDVHSPMRACKRHYSIWYAIKFDREMEFLVEKREFFDAKWMTISAAQEIVTVQENLQALSLLQTIERI